jgi:hypothetical protein
VHEDADLAVGREVLVDDDAALLGAAVAAVTRRQLRVVGDVEAELLGVASSSGIQSSWLAPSTGSRGALSGTTGMSGIWAVWETS